MPQPDLGPLFRQMVGEIFEALRVAEVEAEADDLLAPDRLRQILQLADAPRDEPQRVDLWELLCDLPRKLRAQSGGCAGHDCDHQKRP